MSLKSVCGRWARRALLLSVVGAWTLASPVYSQVLSPVIAGGPHDLTNGSALRNTNTSIAGQTCEFCHVPHGGNNLIPLWNRTQPTGATYQLYTSSTTDVTTTTASLAASVSGACLSCHDGTIAVDVLLNLNGLPFNGGVAFTRQAATAKASYTGPGGGIMGGGLPFLGSDLRNDHPVNVRYETARAAKPTEFQVQAVSGAKISVGATNPVPLYGATSATATVECSSCHNAHNNALGNFLRKSNAGSAICLSCHIK